MTQQPHSTGGMSHSLPWPKQAVFLTQLLGVWNGRQECFEPALRLVATGHATYKTMHASVGAGRQNDLAFAEFLASQALSYLSQLREHTFSPAWRDVHLLSADLALSAQVPDVDRVRAHLLEASESSTVRFPIDADGIRSFELRAFVDYQQGNIAEAIRNQSVVLVNMLHIDGLQAISQRTAAAGITLLQYMGMLDETSATDFDGHAKMVACWLEELRLDADETGLMVSCCLEAVNRIAYTGNHDRAYVVAISAFKLISASLKNNSDTPFFNYEGYFEAFSTTSKVGEIYKISIAQKYLGLLFEYPAPSLLDMDQWLIAFIKDGPGRGQDQRSAVLLQFVAEKIFADATLSQKADAKDLAFSYGMHAAKIFCDLEELSVARKILAKALKHGLDDLSPHLSSCHIIRGLIAIKEGESQKAFRFHSKAAELPLQSDMFSKQAVLSIQAESAIFAGNFDTARSLCERLWHSDMLNTPSEIAILLGIEARIARAMGDLGEALERTDEALGLLTTGKFTSTSTFLTLQVESVRILREQGEIELAFQRLNTVDKKLASAVTWRTLYDRIMVSQEFVNLARITDDEKLEKHHLEQFRVLNEELNFRHSAD